jgi:hypothetical protein
VLPYDASAGGFYVGDGGLIMTTRMDMSEAYEQALNLPKKNSSGGLTNPSSAALNRAHELRKFEIENYWKRATYFWSFQAIAFVVLGFFLKDGEFPQSMQILQLPASIGAISGYVGYLSAKGSKFWQENWESHVDMLEEKIEGRLTQTIWSDGKKSHSVSGLNQSFMGIITLSWIGVMAFASGGIPDCITEQSPWWLFAFLIGILVLIFFSSRQNFTGYVIHQDSWIERKGDKFWNWNQQGFGKQQRQLMLRHIKARDASKPPAKRP